MMKGCPWQDSHLHLAGFEAAVSAVGLHGRELGTPGEICTHTDTGFKAVASALGYGSIEVVSPAGFAPAAC